MLTIFVFSTIDHTLLRFYHILVFAIGAPSQDSYNMAAMNTALPQHTISNIPGQPQVY